MTRHGKNCTAGAVYTYHEKRKDTGEQRGGGGVVVGDRREGLNEQEVPEEQSLL
uniref:Nitric oxide synthase-interacting protein zinc-finger domain-containing protein n=1 Tax=Oryzias sinensis TaxID=183150 RepID=A0A8C7Y301_9TELE